MHYFEHGGHDGVGFIFTRRDLQKQGGQKVSTRKRRKPAFYYGKVCKRLPKWADDDRTDWTMKSAAHAEDLSMHTLRQCGYNDVFNFTVGALLRPKGGQKVTTRWHTTNQADGSCLVGCAEVELWAAVVCPW